jgi:subtilisin family serine protease
MEEPAAPVGAGMEPAFAVTPAPARHIVSFNGGGPSLLEQKVIELGGRVEWLHGAAGIAVVSGLDEAGASAVAGVAGVREVLPDAEFALEQPVAPMEADVVDVVASPTNPAGASRYSWQWNMKAIGAEAAWAAGRLGSADVTVAILDTGIDYDVPDLSGRVDLSRSASFIPADDPWVAAFAPLIGPRHVVSDLHGHGTNVATQVSSNAAVHAGVTSQVTLIGVKVLSKEGTGSLSAVLAGVLYAADQGADVINMSLGGGFYKMGNGIYVGLINNVFNYAKQKGALVVVSAGNEEWDLDHDGPLNKTYCDAPHVVCVSATGPQVPGGTADIFATYSNFGRSAITVAAPGGNYVTQLTGWPWGSGAGSWVWSYCSKTRLVYDEASDAWGYTACIAGNRVTGYIGTSQAAPHVAGLAALLVEEVGKGNPAQVRARLVQGALDLGQPGTDPYFGKGRIDVASTLGL